MNNTDRLFFDHVKDRLKLHNGSSACDILFEGPCSCGAWHTRDDLARRCGPATWQQVVADCCANRVQIPDDLYPERLNEKEW